MGFAAVVELSVPVRFLDRLANAVREFGGHIQVVVSRQDALNTVQVGDPADGLGESLEIGLLEVEQQRSFVDQIAGEQVATNRVKQAAMAGCVENAKVPAAEVDLVAVLDNTGRFDGGNLVVVRIEVRGKRSDRVLPQAVTDILHVQSVDPSETHSFSASWTAIESNASITPR